MLKSENLFTMLRVFWTTLPLQKLPVLINALLLNSTRNYRLNKVLLHRHPTPHKSEYSLQRREMIRNENKGAAQKQHQRWT